MTIGQAMETAQRERPGEATEADMLRWLSQLDAQWFQDVVMRHEHEAGAAFAGYTADTARDTALLIPPRWEEIYIHYLFAMTDQKLGEVERYQNDAALFNQGLTEAQAAYTRDHMPLENAHVKHVFGMGGAARDAAWPFG